MELNLQNPCWDSRSVDVNRPGAPIYLDHQAKTPVDPRVGQAVLAAMTECFGNPNSVDHLHGTWAAQRLYMAAALVGDLLGASAEDIRFTPSATDALRLALAHAVSGHRGAPLRVGVSTVEHPALLDMVRQGERAGLLASIPIACDELARIPLEEIERVLDGGAEVICVIAANNEVGTIQPLTDIAKLVSERGARLLIDASQAAGRIAIDNRELDADYIIVSGHKMYGPSGVGALIGPGLSAARFDWPVGGHEPTPNLPGAVGMAEACRLRHLEKHADEPAIEQLRDRLQAKLFDLVPDMIINGDQRLRLAGNLHISARDAPNDQVVAQLRGKVSISTGAACANGADAPSHVLQAMGLPAWRQEGALRIGMGKFNTVEEIDVAADAIAQAITAVRRG